MGTREEFYENGELINVIDTRVLEEEKPIAVKILKDRAYKVLSKTDWYVTRLAERSVAIPAAIATERAAIIAHVDSMEAAILDANSLEALGQVDYMSFFAEDE